MEQIEEIPDADAVSRQLDSPLMYDEFKGVIWSTAFMFSEPVESLVWRKYKVAINEVHDLGCGRQANVRQRKPLWTYIGAITTTAGQIRAIRTARGHGLAVAHRPEEDQGTYHAEVELLPLEGQKIRSNDRAELRLMLEKVFGPIEGHTCP